jgi:hypothetical protein
MRRHIETLITAHVPCDIPVIRRDGIRGAQTVWREDSRELLEITLPLVKSGVSYAVALHEFGHICGRYQKSRNLIARERWAWAWAKQNALAWTPRLEQYAAEALSWCAEQQWQNDQRRRRTRRPLMIHAARHGCRCYGNQVPNSTCKS